MKIKPFKATVRGKEADETIRKWLETVCETILKEIPGTKSIILTGSFSRGEGPVKVVGKRVLPYNDFDITVIAEKKVPKEKVDRIASEASKKIGFTGIEYFYKFRKEDQKMEKNFYVDLKVLTPEQMGKLLPRFRNFELRNHGLVLYGEDLRHLVPDYELKRIPLSEPAKLLLDRMSQMVEYLSTQGKHEDEFLTYIIQQAYAAINSSLLHLSGNLRIGYLDAVKVMDENYKEDYPELYKKMPGLTKRIRKYIEWKAKPDKLPQKDVVEAWFQARDDLFEVAKFFFSKFTGKRIEDVYSLSEAIRKSAYTFHRPYLDAYSQGISPLAHPMMVLFLKWKYFRRVKKMAGNHSRIFWSGSPDMAIFSVAPLVLMSLKKDFSVDERMFRKAVEMLGRVYHVNEIKDWEGLSLGYANAYIAFFLQSL